MKKLLIKISFFVIPFFLLFILKENFYSKKKGDLYRLGYVFDTKEYNSEVLFKSYYKKKLFKNVTEIDLDKNNSFDLISIGDSFSEQVESGYQNNIMYKSNKSVLNINRNLYDNPIQILNNLLNGDFFKTNKTKYIVLQNVERLFVERSLEVPKDLVFTIDSIKQKSIKSSIKKEEKKEEKKTEEFLSRDMIRFVMYNFNYLYDDNANVSDTYIVKTDKELFSNASNNLLFFKEDITALKYNNDKARVENLNNELNYLAEKLEKLDIKLIVLLVPDKYDLYFNNISNNEKYTKPLLFDYLNKMDKKYIYLDGKNTFSKLINTKKDIYLYDDSHWSPVGSDIIASEILRICK